MLSPLIFYQFLSDEFYWSDGLFCLIDNMEKLHLVIRVSDKKDRRTNKIHLTETGKKLEEKARFIANKTLKEALHGLTLEELRISQEVLRKIFNNTKD